MQTRKKSPIGEGRSKSIYIEPTVNDTAVLLVFYNPARFKRLLANMLYIIKTLREKNIPYFVAECVFKGAKPQIPGATLVLHSNSYMFYKEQLVNKLEKVIPEKYTKLVCMDGDLVFDCPDWVDQTSKLLDKYDIIQPFSEACWLTPDNTRVRSKKPSYAYGLVHKKFTYPKAIHMFHPGFAWAFKRSTFQAINGFFQDAVIGNGDMLFVFNFFKDEVPEHWIEQVLKLRFIIDKWPEYHAQFKAVNPKVGYLPIRVFHIFHGVRHHRQYTTRYKSVSHYLPGTWDDNIFVNKEGLYEFKDQKPSNGVLQYFKRRNEDIPIQEAQKILSRKVRMPIQNQATVQPVQPGSSGSVPPPPAVPLPKFNDPVAPNLPNA